MLSVIIPAYNRRTFLEAAIRSVLDQTSPCGEILVVDDGSTDGTGELVSRLTGSAGVEIRYFFQENRGAAAARNLGIRESRGDLLCFLDSDDFFLPEKIALQKRVFEETDILVAHTKERWLRCGKHLNQKQKHQPPEGYIFPACLPMCVVGMSTVMVRRELFERYGLFDESLSCCEDYDFWLRVSTKERFALINIPLTVKNGGREDQLSRIFRVGMDKYRIRSLVNLLENMPLTSEQARMAALELQRKCEIYGLGCFKHGREEEGRIYLELSKKYRL